MPHKQIETTRLILRPTNLEDAEFIMALMNSPKWLQNIGDRHIKSLSDAEAYIKNNIQPQFNRLGYGNYTLIRKIDGIKIGSCGLYDREGLNGIDIGFALFTAYEKMGYAFESAIILKQMAFENWNVQQINAITSPSNIPSQKLLEKLGFHFEKLINLPDELMLYLASKP